MRTAAPNTAIAIDPNDGADLRLLTRSRLKELDRLRDLGFLQIERLTREAKAIPQGEVFKALLAPKGGVVQFDRLARAIRQVVVLEFELRGLFEAPDRDAPRKLRLVKSDRPGFEPPDLEKLMNDLNDPGDIEPSDLFDIRSDYRTGPMDQVVAGIRRTLGAEPPEDDPFAPPPKRAAAPAPQPQPKPVQPKEPAMRARTEPAKPESAAARKPSAQELAAMKAAVLAIKATNGNGFRAKPGKSRKAKHRHGRGPPR
jgi:hypothetical protein